MMNCFGDWGLRFAVLGLRFGVWVVLARAHLREEVMLSHRLCSCRSRESAGFVLGRMLEHFEVHIWRLRTSEKAIAPRSPENHMMNCLGGPEFFLFIRRPNQIY